MGDRSITDRRRPDVREGLLTGFVVPSFGLALTCLLLLPGCLAFRLQEDNPATIDKSSNQSAVGRSSDDASLTSPDPNSKQQAELAQLLANELCDANPEETAQWARDVRNLDPAQAKIALQLRREMLNRKAALVKQQSFQQVCLTIPDEPPADRFAELPSELVPSQTEIRQTSAWATSSAPTFGHSVGQPTPSSVSIRTVSDRQQVDLRRVGLPFAGRNPSNEDVSGPALPLVPTGPPQLQPPVDNSPSSSHFIEQPTETNPFETDDPKIAPGAPDVQRGGIRDRFSKWGARFGFGNDEPEELSAPPQPVSPDSPDLQALDQQPVTSLQTLILLREDELRELGVVPPNDDQKRQDFIRQHVELRLLYLMNGQQSRALDAIPGISSSEQEFWQQVLWGLSDYFDLEGKASRTERISQTVKQFETAVNRLKEEARLSIRNLNFCRKISSYGNYEPFRRDDFTAGQPVLVYSEVENFKSLPVADGRYRTLLKSRIEIFRGDVGGQMVDSISFKPTEDLCRNPRRDYFHSYELTIPQDIGLGPHVLRLTIEDQLTGKQSTQTVNFSVK